MLWFSICGMECNAKSAVQVLDLPAGKGIRVVEQKYALKEFLERAQRHMEAKDKKQVS